MGACLVKINVPENISWIVSQPIYSFFSLFCVRYNWKFYTASNFIPSTTNHQQVMWRAFDLILFLFINVEYIFIGCAYITKHVSCTFLCTGQTSKTKNGMYATFHRKTWAKKKKMSNKSFLSFFPLPYVLRQILNSAHVICCNNSFLRTFFGKFMHETKV